MQRIEEGKSTLFRNNGRELRMLWDSLTVGTPEGARVMVVDSSKPSGQRIIFDKSGADHELNDLKALAEELIRAELG